MWSIQDLKRELMFIQVFRSRSIVDHSINESIQKTIPSGISGTLSKSFACSETQTVNPAVSPRNNARIGGFRKRKFFLSPGRKEGQTKSNNELKSAKMNAKVIEVVIKSEPEDTVGHDEAARLFYPVDVSCGQCPLVDRNRTTSETNSICQSKSVPVHKNGSKCTLSNPLSHSLNKNTVVDHKKTNIKLENSLFTDCARPAGIITDLLDDTQESSLSLRSPQKRPRSGSIEIFSCSSCPGTFSSAAALWDHIRIKDSCPQTKIISKCCFCPHNLEKRINLLRHINRVHVWLRCEYCEDTLPSSKAKEHTAFHFETSRPKADRCFMCNFSHENPQVVMSAHAQHKHLKYTEMLDESTLSDSISCSACGLEFYEQKALSLHKCRSSQTKRKKLAEKKSYSQPDPKSLGMSKSDRPSTPPSLALTCDVCVKTFCDKYKLKRHLRRAAGCRLKREQMKDVKPIVPIIDKSVKKVRSRSSPITCKICKKTFYNNANLTRHQANTRSCLKMARESINSGI